MKPAGSRLVTVSDTINSNSTEFTIVQPSISLTPDSGLVGSNLTVSGQGFNASSPIAVTFGTKAISGCASNGSGALNCTFAVPGVPAGTYPVTASDSVNSAPSEPFRVGTPVLTLSVSSGTVHSRITVTGVGFAPGEEVTLLFNATAITTKDCLTPGGLTVNSSGGFSCNFLVPAYPSGEQLVAANDSVNSANATFTIVAALNLHPSNDSYDQSVTVVGTGFDSDVDVSVIWDGGATLCIATSHRNGSFSCAFYVPNVPAGTYPITVEEGSNHASADFRVDPTFSVSPLSRAVGSLLTVVGYGFEASTSFTVIWDFGIPPVIDCGPSSVTTLNGSLNCAFEVPATPGGVHNVSILEGPFYVNRTITVTPSFAIYPDVGVAGSDVSLTGTALAASTKYLVCLQSSVVSCPSGTSSSFTTASNGTVPAGTVFTIPSVAPSGTPYDLIVSLGTTVEFSSDFTVTEATVVLNPSAGTVGASVQLSGSQFVPGATYLYCFQSSPSACSSATTTSFNATSTGTIPSTVPALVVPPGPAGDYYVDVSAQGDLIGSSEFALQANLTGTPDRVTVGTQVTVIGTGFVVSSAYSLPWNSTVSLCAQTTGGTGGFSCSFFVPQGTAGPHVITATAGSIEASFTLTIVPFLSSSPDNGTVGTLVQVSGTGFDADASFTVAWQAATPECTGHSSVSGSFACSFTIPAAPTGTHAINATEGSHMQSAEFVVIPSLGTSPSSGPVGSTGILTWTGFDANAAVVALWNGTADVCSGTTTGTGSYACAFTVPTAPGGLTPILTKQDGNAYSVDFTVTSSLNIAPHEGIVGSRVGVSVQGLVASEPVRLLWNGSTTLCSGSAESDGSYFCNLTVPAAPAGTHTLTATQASSSLLVAFAVVPSFAIYQLSGPVGSSVQVSGEGFDANANFALAWNASTTLCTGTTTSNGGLSCTFVVPASPGGSHMINATEGSYTLGASFGVTASLSISPTSAAVGSTVTVTGEGFGADSSYVVSWSATGVLCSGSTDTNGGFLCTFVVPSVSPGNYTISGTQGTNSPAVTLSISPGPPSSPFPWWLVAVIVVGGVAGLLAILLYYRRRPAPRPRRMRPWEESETPTTSTQPEGETRPVPLFPSPPQSPVGVPSQPPEVRSTVPSAPVAAEPPPEDIDVLIARLDRMAKELFKNKPPPGATEESSTNEGKNPGE